MQRVIWSCLGMLLLGWLSACQDAQRQHEVDVTTIRSYLQGRNIDAEQDPDADYFYYFYVANDRQKLVKANAGLILVLRYSATLLDGTVITDTGNYTVLVELDNTIYGWQLALPRMSIGERMLLVLPSRLAYADAGSPAIPPNSNLVFEIELLDVYPQF